jgi:DNA-binding XRE family transcriptional regulator
MHARRYAVSPATFSTSARIERRVLTSTMRANACTSRIGSFSAISASGEIVSFAPVPRGAPPFPPVRAPKPAETAYNVRRLYNERGWKQEELGDAAGLTQSQIRGIELAKLNIRLDSCRTSPKRSAPAWRICWTRARASSVDARIRIATAN